jgi:hypothetical protein
MTVVDSSAVIVILCQEAGADTSLTRSTRPVTADIGG